MSHNACELDLIDPFRRWMQQVRTARCTKAFVQIPMKYCCTVMVTPRHLPLQDLLYKMRCSRSQPQGSPPLSTPRHRMQ